MVAPRFGINTIGFGMNLETLAGPNIKGTGALFDATFTHLPQRRLATEFGFESGFIQYSKRMNPDLGPFQGKIGVGLYLPSEDHAWMVLLRGRGGYAPLSKNPTAGISLAAKYLFKCIGSQAAHPFPFLGIDGGYAWIEKNHAAQVNISAGLLFNL